MATNTQPTDGDETNSYDRLTEIKGIGPATAPEIARKTGISDPHDLASAYLAGEVDLDGFGLRLEYVREWIVQATEGGFLELPEGRNTPANAKVLLFRQAFGEGSKFHATLPHPTGTESWDRDPVGTVWVGEEDTVGVVKGHQGLLDLYADEDMLAEYGECDGCELDTDGLHLYQFDAGRAGTSNVKAGYIDALLEIFEFDLADVQVYRSERASSPHSFPIIVHDQDTDLIVTVAPYIGRGR